MSEEERPICVECCEEVDFKDMSMTRAGVCYECAEYLDAKEAEEDDAYNHMPEGYR